MSPLGLCVNNDDRDMVDLLITSGATITPVAFCCAHNEEMIKLLMDKGGNINGKVQALGQEFSGWSALTFAINKGKKCKAKRLIRNGADVNTQDDQGILLLYTP
jgi:ankyrin repeat protein